MTTGESVSSDDKDITTSNSITSMESAAQQRKRRLMELRARVKNSGVNERVDEGNMSTSEDAPKLKFRSYDPTATTLGAKVESKDLFAIDKLIEDQLADTENKSVVEEVSIATLAPRKVDWDLKRDIADRMAKLERRTERAIAELIRQRLAADKTVDVATVVNSGAYIAIETDD
ncbi:hypothetical protein AB6A40_003261 [Gnathostoma spinigerum]|uniref:Coiled-coil domain-containing protein 12 n=1 Tax=Gnathostoma spinigerum TaxID=75299 RepID=A0ABD6EJ07_9BILA